MQYDELTLQPPNGTVDVASVNAWLGQQPYAFLDPVDGDSWHLSGTAEEMEKNRAARVASTRSFPAGVRVLVLPDRVIIAKRYPMAAELHMLELVRWLVRDGGWTVAIDYSPPEPIGDPRRLFPDGIDEPDHTVGPLTEGVRVTWEVGDRTFIGHSSGQWRASGWRGELTAPALVRWDAAIATVRAREDAFREYVEPDTATGRLELETPDDFDIAYFDAAQTPEHLRPIEAIVDRWLAELAVWTLESTSADFRRVRST